MNTGFSWVRIDKGTIHCNFRYLSLEQVQSVINYLKSYYEYQNITYSFVDLGAAGVIQETGDHYRPSPNDPAQDYYWLVELHRHGTIIPQGCITIIKTALNALAQHAIIPQSVYIKRLSSNVFTVEDTANLELITVNPNPYTGTVLWSSSDTDIVTVDPDGMTCEITAVAPGEADVIATITVPEDTAKALKVIPTPSALWVGNTIKFIGDTEDYYVDSHGTYYPASHWHSTDLPSDIIHFVNGNYYDCNKSGTTYSWDASSYDGTPIDVYYRDSYTIAVRTYVRITTKDVQKLCLYHNLANPLQATSPSYPDLPIVWYTETSGIVSFDGLASGASVQIIGDHVGSTVITAKVTDPYGIYTDSLPMSVYAMSVTPHSIKLVAGATKNIVIHKDDIFMTEYQAPGAVDPSPIPVSWVSSSDIVATVEALITPTDPVLDHAEATVTAQGVGKTYVTVMAEDPTDGTVYSDVVDVTVGNVAITETENVIIPLFPPGSETYTLTADLTAGFTIDSDGWESANSDVVQVTTISGTDNNTCLITGIAAGSAFITVTAKNGAAVDTDRVLVKVTDANYVTSGEMRTFTRGQFNGHGVVDWDPEHPVDVEVDEDLVDLATQPEVDEFIDGLFDANSSESEDGE